MKSSTKWHNLWTKETDRVGSLYVNLFEVNDSQFVAKTKKWDEYLQALILTLSEKSAKSNQKSSDLIQEARDQFQNELFFHAFELYTKALCYAELNTANESIAIANRARRFSRMKMYHQALKDLELALSISCSDKMSAQLERLRAAC